MQHYLEWVATTTAIILDFRHGPRNWLQVRLPAAAFIRKTIVWLPSGWDLRGRQRGIRIHHFTHAVGEVGGGGYSRRIPFLTGMSICQLCDNFISFTAPWRLYHPSILLRWKTRIEDCPLLKTPDMDAFKALQASHSDCASLDSATAWTHAAVCRTIGL
jgi:hypothetical protein